jgi:hypothetical protein
MLDFGTRNMPFSLWKCDTLRSFLWIIKYYMAQDTVFIPHCKSIQDLIATVQQTAVAIKSKWLGCGFSQIAVPAYRILAWTEVKE